MPSPPSQNPATILVADDTPMEREHARRALEAAGYRVIAVEDGQQALDAYLREQPDVVMLDVVMPRLSGLDACRILKAQARGAYVPIILVSSRNSVGARVEGLRCGADDYLGKPYDDEELRARVEALLRVRKATSGKVPAAVRSAPGGAVGGGDEDAFLRRLEEEFDRARRYSDPLACLLSALAPDAPELAERALQEAVESCVRKIDLVHRRTPKEYLLVLPNTHFPGALSVAERIFGRVRNRGGGAAGDGLSVGVSFFPSRVVGSADDLLAHARRALARAVDEGGGYICLYQHEGYLYRPEDGDGAGNAP